MHTHTETPHRDDPVATSSTTIPAHGAVVYVRISDDPLGLESGVTRQKIDVPLYAVNKGFDNCPVFEDNDESASTYDTRPGYRRLVAAIKRGEVRHVVVLHSSRIWRNRIERAQGIELFKRYGVILYCVKGMDVDPTTSEGRAMADVAGSMNTWESELKAERVADQVRHAAAAGTPTGQVPYGFRRTYHLNAEGVRVGIDRQVHHPDEAPVVEEVCRRLLTGESVLRVTNWLNREGGPKPPGANHRRKKGRGVANPDGTRWSQTGVRVLATRPVNCGMRWYHLGREDETLLEMRSDPIITREEWDQLVARFGKPTRWTKDEDADQDTPRNTGDHTGPRPGRRKHLLTQGLGRCGVCGGLLRRQGPHGRSGPTYDCDGVGHCVSRNQARVDDWVRENVIDRLSRPDAADLLVGNDHRADRLLAEITHLTAKGKEIEDDYRVHEVIDREEYLTAKRQNNAKLQRAKDAAEELTPDVPVALLQQVIADPEVEYDRLEVHQRFTLCRYLMTQVVIKRTTKGVGFKREHVKINWRSDLVTVTAAEEDTEVA